MNRLPSHFSAILLVAALVACSLLISVTTLYVLWVSHWHGPFRDMWEIYPFLEKIVQNTWVWCDLWESYGYAHRLLVPRLLFVADYQFSDANNHLLIAISLLCQLAIVGIFARILFAHCSWPIGQRWCLFLPVVMFQFSGTLLFNFMHTFDVQWFLCCFFVTAAFYLLSSDQSARPALLIALSGLLIVLACLCNFSAMAAWPVWTIFVYTRVVSLSFRWGLVLIAGIFIVIYGADIKASGAQFFPSENIAFIAMYFFLQFPLLYLGNPVLNPDYLPLNMWAIALVIMPMLLLVRFWYGVIRKKTTDINPVSVFFPSIMLFCFGVALMTGLGRGYDPSHVYASRYQNIVVLFWSATVPFLFMETQNMAIAKKSLYRMSGMFFLAGFIACQWQSWHENLLLGRNVSRAHLALMMGYSNDIPMIFATVSRSMIYVPGYNLEQERLLHEQARKGIYSDTMAENWLNGVPLRDIEQQCEGIEWKLTDRITPYSRFVEFLVTGGIENYTYAMLVDETDTVVAVAIPFKESLLHKIFQRVWSPSPASLRGFSRTLDGNNLSLVMASSHHRCILP